MKLLIGVFILTRCAIGGLFNDEIINKVEVIDPNIKIVIEGVRSEKGKIVIAVFKDQQGFKARKPIKRIELKKSELEGNEIELNLEPGIYGISVLDDDQGMLFP